MARANKYVSAKVTFVLCIIMTLAFLSLTVSLPWAWKWAVGFFDTEYRHYTFTLCFLYPACLMGVVASSMLVLLMKRIMRNLVFSPITVSLIRGISWCCFGVTPLFVVIGFCYYSVFALAFATSFLGVLLRVVKNVLEQGSEYKKETELTI